MCAFLFELSGVPAGTVSLDVNGDRYVYRSRQLFDKAGKKSAVERVGIYAVSDAGVPGAVWESLWLSHKPQDGCVRVRAELGGEVGEACARSVGDQVQGTVLGKRFDARYRAGRLSRLELGDATFTPLVGDVPPPPDLFGEGFPVEGRAGALTLDGEAPRPPRAPSLGGTWRPEQARALAREVNQALGGTDADCVAFARRFQADAHRPVEVVFGLVAEGAHAFPHAWNRVGLEGGRTLDVDATTCEPVTPQTHLAFEPGKAGETYLALLSGRAKVVRR